MAQSMQMVKATVVNESDTAQEVTVTHTVFPKGGDEEDEIGTVNNRSSVNRSR